MCSDGVGCTVLKALMNILCVFCNTLRMFQPLEKQKQCVYFPGNNHSYLYWLAVNYILCPQGSSGEVHCEKVTCPVLSCSHPVRRNPSDCCKECPEDERTPAGLQHSDMMQADGLRHCKFGKNYYQNNDNWHPWVPLVGEMKCINCWCDVSSYTSRCLSFYEELSFMFSKL